MLGESITEARIRRMCLEKTAFISKDEAKRAKHEFRKARGFRVSVYRCSYCQCWHFTANKEQD